MRNKVLGLLLTVTLIILEMTGCTGAKGTNESTEQLNNTAQESDNKSEDKITLKWALWDASNNECYKVLADAFMDEHPEVNIEMVDLGSADYSTALGTQLAGENADYDVVTIKDVPGYVTLVKKGVLEPLDSFIEKDGIDLSCYSGVTDQLMMNGWLYELPFRSDIWIIYYNKDIFDLAGVPYPTNDMTWKQYDKLCRKVAGTYEGRQIYGAHYHTWRSTVQLDGILDGKNTIVDGHYEFTKPYYEMVLSQQKDKVCMDYATLKTRGLHYSAAFAQGNVATMNMGSWFISTLINKIKEGEYTQCANWGIVKYPHAEGVEPGSTLSTITALAIPKAADNKEAAWDFVRFVSGEKGAEIMARTGNIPAMRGEKIAELIAGMDGFPNDEASKEALVTSHTYLEMPAIDKSSEIEAVLNKQHDLLMNEETGIDEAITAMNEGVQAIIN
ncbi:ABC transporter substrate-binding protein [Butyrivibrio sp. INlla21]|uniref:ABC transporter substrate-binding protein n=1 Tax=Butyrivibrio sp. INlla21 TaxID=1520811 RepID=UPI0008E459CB|nr:sugar ABC transporter substrate-binding protein [Butyrivibrio sp. INlla21]SFU77027.1 multiple sugar transport system substrate-binding protein [Butyrivibrio sp. INlla21]